MENIGIFVIVLVKGVFGWGSKLQGNFFMVIWIVRFFGNSWNKRIINFYNMLIFCIRYLIEFLRQFNKLRIIFISQKWKVNFRLIY